MSNEEEEKKLNERRALLLHASRDMAFEQMSVGARMVPFAAGVNPDGEIKFFRFAEIDTEVPLAEVYADTQSRMAGAAKEGVLVASSTVAVVEDSQLEAGFETAVSVHVEEPGFSRMVLAPYRVEPGEGEGAKNKLVQGEMLAFDVAPIVFAA
jgi:hypothetical protein